MLLKLKTRRGWGKRRKAVKMMTAYNRMMSDVGVCDEGNTVVLHLRANVLIENHQPNHLFQSYTNHHLPQGTVVSDSPGECKVTICGTEKP